MNWVHLTTSPNAPSAQALAQSLLSYGVTCKVRSDDTSLLGEGRMCDVFVDSNQLRRAEWLLEQGRFSDAELTFLATGELRPEG